MRDDRLVVVDAVAGDDAAKAFLTTHGVASAMAAPVSEGGNVVGSLAIGSREPRHYTQRDQQILLALAEHASLALNHTQAVEDVVHESLHDSLTGLANRTLLLDRIRQALARAERRGGSVAVLFCDLDSFKTINDSLGPTAGDELLVAVGRRISASLRPADTVARLGGDEFAVLLDEVTDRSDAERAARRILESLEAPIELGEREIWAGVSIGIASGEADAETLLRNADLAMYRAKGSGRGKYALFEPQMHTAVVERLDLEVDLKRAIEREELALVYQPIYYLRTDRIAGFEALVRWRHPTRGLVVPARFVPLAEQSGQIGALGRWVLRTACHQAALWQAKYPAHLGLGVSVNISGVELREPTISKEVASAVGAAGLDPGSLTLEITETALMEDSEGSVERLEALKRLGVKLAVDDFGTGYSSLRYLQRFPLDTLKIDRFFVDEMGPEGSEPALLRAMVDLADNFGLDVVAEGIETTVQRTQLVELGCEMGQGLLLSAPLPVEEADTLLLGAGLLPPSRRAEAPEGVAEPLADDAAREDATQ
jgi:diguanylate cyclase (GGDEF)-like protein